MVSMARNRRQSAATSPVKWDGSAGVYLFVGQELFLRRTNLHRLIDTTLGDADPALAVAEFDGAIATPAQVLDELRTLPFLAARRIVIVHDADKFITDNRATLERYAETPCATGVLILLADRSQGNTNLQKAVAAAGGVVACDKLNTSELGGWIRDRAKDAYGKTIDYQTASLLADLVGDDLGRLDSELDKLATFLGEGRKTISADDVDELVANQRLHDAFELTGAIAAKDAREALVRWNDMINKDSSAPYTAVGLIAWQVRRFLQARQLRRQGLSRDEVLSRLRVPPFLRNSFAEQVRSFSEPRLRLLLRELVSVDLAAKTGGAPPERSIETFIVHACEK